MKGVIYILLNQLVEEKSDMETWEKILTRANPISNGIYISSEDYSDDELFSLVNATSDEMKVPVPQLLKIFGTYLFENLNNKYPIFSEKEPTFFGFIESIDGVIHKEVEKLYKNPNLPTLRYSRVNDTNLHIEYRSPRKLCLLAEGLIWGAAEHYAVNLKVEHPVCMHQGNDHCKINLSIQ